jgi:hypothetical protein
MFENKFQAVLFALIAATPVSVIGSCWVQKQSVPVVVPAPVVVSVPPVASVEGKSYEYFVTQYDLYSRVTLKVRSYKAFIDNVKDESTKPKLREDLAAFSSECESIVNNYNTEAKTMPTGKVQLPKTLAVEACK